MTWLNMLIVPKLFFHFKGSLKKLKWDLNDVFSFNFLVKSIKYMLLAKAFCPLKQKCFI